MGAGQSSQSNTTPNTLPGHNTQPSATLQGPGNADFYVVSLATDEPFDHNSLLEQYSSRDPLVVLGLERGCNLDNAWEAYYAQYLHINPELAPADDVLEYNQRYELHALLNKAYEKILAKPNLLTKPACVSSSSSMRLPPEFPARAARFIPNRRQKDATGWTSLSEDEETYGVAVNGSMRTYC